MEIVKFRYSALQKALRTLDDGIEIFNTTEISDRGIYDLMRDGVIQRFEYCIDSFWKFFKLYLETVHKISVEPPSPRIVLRTIFINQLMTQEEQNTLEKCLYDRNLTSHTYNAEIAEAIYNHIPLYYMTMKTVIERLDFPKEESVQ